MDNSTTPTLPCKEPAKCHEFHSLSGRKSFIDPQDPWLKQEFGHYGVLTEAAARAHSYGESCRERLNEELHQHGYKVTKLINAHIVCPKRMGKLARNKSQDSNLIGYVAFNNNDSSGQIGRTDIIVAWRGTIKHEEWFKNVQFYFKTIDGPRKVRVEHGFNSIYTSKCNEQKSASEQVMEEVKRLVESYKDEARELRLTITGHSLGGALALLSAYEAASYFLPRKISLKISVISFGAPQVGNKAFGDRLVEMKVEVKRVRIKKDVVPKLPGKFIKKIVKGLDMKYLSVGRLWQKGGLENWKYADVGTELILNAGDEDTPCKAHKMKTYLLHLNCSAGCGAGEQNSVEK